MDFKEYFLTQIMDFGAGKDIPDALGTDGTTVTDSAVSVLGAIGANNANNAFASNLVAANAEGSVLERQEYAQSILGALTDVAADTTDTATMTALLRQIAEAVNNGAGTAIGAGLSIIDLFGAFDGGADCQGDIYQALGVDAGKSLKGEIDDVQTVVGALTDIAADTTDTATSHALLRQIAEAVNNGAGTAIGAGLSIIDLFGAFDGGADAQGDIYQALGVDAGKSIKGEIDDVQAVTGVLTDTALETTDTATLMNLMRSAIARGTSRIVRKTVTFTGAEGLGAVGSVNLFTVLGLVKMRIMAICSVNLASDAAPGGATIEVGVAGTTNKFIATTTAEDIDAADIWHDATPDAAVEADSVAPFYLNYGCNVIATVAVDDVVSGVITFIAEYVPLESGSAMSAA